MKTDTILFISIILALVFLGVTDMPGTVLLEQDISTNSNVGFIINYWMNTITIDKQHYYCTTEEFSKWMETKEPFCGWVEDYKDQYGGLVKINGDWINIYWLEEKDIKTAKKEDLYHYIDENGTVSEEIYIQGPNGFEKVEII